MMDGQQTQITPATKLRTRLCKQCGVQFSYKIGKGADRLHCTAVCREAYQKSRAAVVEWARCSVCGARSRAVTASLCNAHYTLERNRKAGVCVVRKCTLPAVRIGHGLCEKHYGRMRRGAPLDADRPVIGRYVQGAGYIKLLRRDHPMADVKGQAFEHRVVLYDSREGVDPDCYWCGKNLTWKTTVVDHLNEVKDDNRPENLVPACNDCNRARGAMVPFIRRMRCEAVEPFIEAVKMLRGQGDDGLSD